METEELYCPQIKVQAGGYSFNQGVEIEVCSARSSHSDWAKIRFTEQFQPEIALNRKDPAAVFLGYGGVLTQVFTGYIAKPFGSGDRACEISMKDNTLLLEETVINDTFLSTTPQELISFFLTKAGITEMKLSPKNYPRRKTISIRRQNAVRAIETVNNAWGIQFPFFFSDGVFYWGEMPDQDKVYTFEYGVNILRLERRGGLWDLETVSVPFVKHSHKINVIHPLICGEREVSKVAFSTNDSGFIRTHIYF